MRSWLEGNSWPEIGFKMTQHFKSIKQTQTVKLHQAHWPVHTGLRCTVKANPVKHWISPVVPTPHPSPLSPLTLLLCTPTVRRVPPRFSIPPTNHEVMPGGSVNLTCVAVGAPMPYVKWISGEVELTREDEMPIGRNVLELTNIRQSANYTCVAISSLGMIETTAQITVKGKKHSPLWGWDGVKEVRKCHQSSLNLEYVHQISDLVAYGAFKGPKKSVFLLQGWSGACFKPNTDLFLSITKFTFLNLTSKIKEK